MKGELGYKDIHGRFWAITESPDFTHVKWAALTADVGHTKETYHVAADVELLLGVLDSEEYAIDKAAEPIEAVQEIAPDGVWYECRYCGVTVTRERASTVWKSVGGNTACISKNAPDGNHEPQPHRMAVPKATNPVAESKE